MAQTLELSVVAPDRSVVETTITSAVLPGQEGYFGVWPGHTPLVAALRPGLVEYTDETNNQRYISVAGGFAEVQPNRITVLADEAQLAHEIDLSRAEADLEEARKALRGEDSTFGSDQAVQELEKALQRVKAARLAK